MTGRWEALADVEAVGPGMIAEGVVDGQDLVVWRSMSGEICAMEARCPHQWSHLGGQGAVDGDEIVCVTHGWRFRADGSGWKVAMNGRRDRKGDIEVYPCRERDGIIEVEVST